MQNYIKIGEEETGFAAGRSCADDVFTLRRLMENRRLRGREIRIVFVELENACNPLLQSKMFQE